MAALGLPNVPAEGRFFPDTYHYSRGATDMTVLRAAQQMLQKKLEAAWAERAKDVPLKSIDEALIMASIVEKETGLEADRTKVSSVFNNRLRIGMPLQTDPTVIYGLGDAFDGNLRKKDLLADTPYNTYTREGLAADADRAARRQLDQGGAAAGADQGAVFRRPRRRLERVLRNLADHNRAVNQFQRGSKQWPRAASSPSKASTAPASPRTSSHWRRGCVSAATRCW